HPEMYCFARTGSCPVGPLYDVEMTMPRVNGSGRSYYASFVAAAQAMSPVVLYQLSLSLTLAQFVMAWTSHGMTSEAGGVCQSSAGWSCCTRGNEVLRVLLALMILVLPTFQAKAADPVSAPVPVGAASVRTDQITGAGGTFPAPVYARWADAARSAIGVD